MKPPAFRELTLVTLVVASLAATTACSYPTVALEDKGAPVTPSDDAKPSPMPPSAEDTTASPDVGAPPASQAGDAGPSPCSEADLTLCFAFEGNVMDTSQGNVSPTTSNAASFAPGRSGLAALVGEESFIRFAALPTLTTPSATVEAWINPSQKRDGVVFDASDRYSLRTHGNGQLGCVTQGADVRGGAIPIGVWTHVACVFDGNKVVAYVNGVPVGNGNGSTGSSLNAPVAIGGDAPSGSPFVGLLDDVRVFRVGRTAAQIAAEVSGP